MKKLPRLTVSLLLSLSSLSIFFLTYVILFETNVVGQKGLLESNIDVMFFLFITIGLALFILVISYTIAKNKYITNYWYFISLPSILFTLGLLYHLVFQSPW